LLHDVEHAGLQRSAPVSGRKSGRGIGEIGHPARGDDDGIGIADRIVGSGVMLSNPLTASAAIIRPSMSKSKPRTRPPVAAKISCPLPSGAMRMMLPL